MGERAEGTLFRPEFNRSVRVEAAPSALTEDAGAILLRTVADRLGLPGALARVLDHRVKHLVTHPLVELLTTRILLLVERKHEPYTSAVMPPSYTPSRPSASARGRRKRASRAPDPA